MRAPVNKIIPFSFVDGFGNRTAIFLQGCNQSCLYCHNPETINLCFACGECVKICPEGALSLENGRVVYDIKKCRLCDGCLRVCRFCSSPRVRELTPSQVFDEVWPNLPFIDGVTVSGGECTLYPDFLRELFTLVKAAGRTTYIDTNGQTPLWPLTELLAVTDKTMIDLKSGDDGEHRKLAGLGLPTVIRNIEETARLGKLYEIRTVCVPGVLDNERTVRLGAGLIARYPEVRYKLIKYRPFGVRAGVLDGVPSPDDAEMARLRDISVSLGVTDVVVT